MFTTHYIRHFWQNTIRVPESSSVRQAAKRLPRFRLDPKIAVALVTAIASVVAASIAPAMNRLKGEVNSPTSININIPGNVPTSPLPQSVDVIETAMLTSLNHDEFDAALRLADEVLQTNPKSFRAYNTKGSVAFYRGQFQEAAKHFEKAHSLKPDSVGYTWNLADTYVELGWTDRAIVLYDSVRSASTEWWYSQGRAYLLARRYGEAERLLALVPTNHNRGTARVLRAAALAALGDLRESKAEYRAGVTQDPQYWQDVLAGTRIETRESYKAVAQLLEDHHVPSS
jgi:tetratricopeptide (TPR) repeat protein